MNIRRIFLIIACLVSAGAVFVPCYMVQIDYETVRDGYISLFSAYPYYGIAILVLDLFVIGATVVGLKKGYVIASLINIGVTISSLVNIYINRESASAVLRVTSNLLSSLSSKGPTLNYRVEDGAGFFMLVFAAIFILVSMIWNAVNNDD